MAVLIFINTWTLNSNFIENGDDKDFQLFTGVTGEQYTEFSDYMLGTRVSAREWTQPLIAQNRSIMSRLTINTGRNLLITNRVKNPATVLTRF